MEITIRYLKENSKKMRGMVKVVVDYDAHQ